MLMPKETADPAINDTNKCINIFLSSQDTLVGLAENKYSY